MTVPAPHGPTEWLHGCIDQGPFSEHDRSVSVVIQLGDAASRIEAVVTDWRVPS